MASVVAVHVAAREQFRERKIVHRRKTQHKWRKFFGGIEHRARGALTKSSTLSQAAHAGNGEFYERSNSFGFVHLLPQGFATRAVYRQSSFFRPCFLEPVRFSIASWKRSEAANGDEFSLTPSAGPLK